MANAVVKKRNQKRIAWGRKGVRAPRARKGTRFAMILDEAFALVTAQLDAENGDLASIDEALKAVDAELADFTDNYDPFEGVYSATMARAIIDVLSMM